MPTAYASQCARCGHDVAANTPRPRRYVCTACGGTATRYDATGQDHGQAWPAAPVTATPVDPANTSPRRYRLDLDGIIVRRWNDDGMQCASCPRADARTCAHVAALRAALDRRRGERLL